MLESHVSQLPACDYSSMPNNVDLFISHEHVFQTLEFQLNYTLCTSFISFKFPVIQNDPKPPAWITFLLIRGEEAN
jgi:hypothetical protein